MQNTQRKNRLSAKLSGFLQQYERKSQKNTEPNDRKYSRKIEEKLKRMPATELSALLLSEQTEREDDETGSEVNS